MKDKILEVVERKPKHYTRIIKNDTELFRWVEQNSIIESDHLPSKIRSAVFQETNICEYGNTKSLRRFNTGFQNCGPASRCQCTAEDISASVSITKSNYTADQHRNINKKRSETMIKKYGCQYNSQRANVKEILKSPKISLPVHEKLSNLAWLKNEYIVLEKSASTIARELGVYYSTVIDYCRRHGFEIRQHYNYSDIEIQIAEFIRNSGIGIETNNRSVLDGKELDIYVPSRNCAIELNGLYWHSYNPNTGTSENRNRHLEKSLLAYKAGITLLHFTDYQWMNHQDAVKTILLSKLGLNQKIYGRNTKIIEISSQIEKEFLNTYHLQGWAPGSKKLGMYYNGDLVGVANFRNSRFDNQAKTELLRVCFKKGISVVGGVSKFLNHSGYSQVMSYSKNDLGFSNLEPAGFRFIDRTGPGYFWTDGNNIISRYSAQKSKLKDVLKEKFDPALSEAENMFLSGYRRFWDTGNTKWIWEKNYR